MSVGCGSTCRLISMRICLVHFSFLWLPSFGRKIVEVLAGGCEVVDPLQLMELVMATVKLCLAFSPVVCISLSWLVHLLPCKLSKVLRTHGKTTRNPLNLRMYRGRASICRGLRVVAFLRDHSESKQSKHTF